MRSAGFAQPITATDTHTISASGNAVAGTSSSGTGGSSTYNETTV